MSDQSEPSAWALTSSVPEVFYDIIARVLPGFFLLLGARLELSGTKWVPPGWLTLPDTGTIGPILYGLAFAFSCYLLGWVLRPVAIRSHHSAVLARFERSSAAKGPTLRTQYQIVRLYNPTAGFRILKLRAEARMLETSRTAMMLLFALGVSQVFTDPSSSFGVLCAKITAPLLFALALYHAERPVWEAYYGNIAEHYAIMSGCGLIPKTADTIVIDTDSGGRESA